MHAYGTVEQKHVNPYVFTVATLNPGVMMLSRRNVWETSMSSDSIRSTVYLEPALRQALRLKAVTANRSMSEIVNDALRAVLREDEADLASFAERAPETSLSYQEFLARLKADGTL